MIEEFIQKATITELHTKLRELHSLYIKTASIAREKAKLVISLSTEYNKLFDKYEKLHKQVYGEIDYEI